MTKWRPHAPDVAGAKQFYFECFYCPKGKIRLSLHDWQDCEGERMRRKCPACKTWVSFYRDGDTFYDVKGESIPEKHDLSED